MNKSSLLKLFLSLTLVFSSLAALLTPARGAQVDNNLVLNPGFETAGTSAADAADWAEGTDHIRDSDKFHTGGWSLHSAFRGAGTDTRTEAAIPVSPDTNYLYSGYIWRMDDIGGACMDMNDALGEAQLCAGVSGSWQFLSGIWNSGSNTSVTLRLITDGLPTGDIWFDDISLTEAAPPTSTPTPTLTITPGGPTLTPTMTNTPSTGNLVLNPGFETAGTSAADAADWSEGTNHVRASDKFHTGGWSLYSTFRGAGTDTRTAAPIAVSPDTNYLYSGYLWRTDLFGGACMDMNDALGEAQLCGSRAGSWQLVSGMWNSGSNTGVTLRLITDGSPTGDIWFDDISLTEQIGPIVTPTNTPAPPTHTPVPGVTAMPRVMHTIFPSDDIVVASWSVTDPPFNADNTGVRDATAAIQDAIQAAEDAGGGVVWMPAGKYRVTGSIHIYNHVTLRGDWRDPDLGRGAYGTVVLADVPGGDDTGPGLFRIWGSAGVKGLTVYYPNQTLPDPTSYPYTFEILGRYLGEDGYISGTVQNVTMLNSYRGISAGKDNTHEMHVLKNVKGTPLMTGIYLQDTADVGKVQRIKFDGTYWADLDGSVSKSKPTLAAINAWTRLNGTGLQLGGVEWDEMVEISLSDYQTGVTFVPGRRINTTAMFYDLTVLNSNVALNLDHLDHRIATVFSNCTLKANQGTDPVAVKVADNKGTSVIFNNCTIGGGASKAVEVTGNTLVNFQNTTFDHWTGPYGITTTAGSLVSEGNTFLGLSSRHKGINLETGTSSAVVLQSKYWFKQGDYLLFNNGTAIPDPSEDSGSYRRKDSGFWFAKHDQGAYPWRSIPRPATHKLYNVRAAPYNAVADGVTDATAAIQQALNDAALRGGGTVYLPAGIYMIRTHLIVGPGVELRGSEDVQHRAELNTQNGGPAMGTILYAVEGKGSDTGMPFISLHGNGAGVRGLSVLYPEQNMTLPLAPYPWTIRGKGINVYAYDLAFVNAYKGIDFGTYRTDGHYVSQVTGLALKEGIRVGNAYEGWLEGNLFNINAWARSYGLPNRLDEKTTMWTVADAFTKENFQAFIIGDGARDEHILNNFVYGAWAGYTFEGSAQATAINMAGDGTLDTIRVTGTGPRGVKIINTEGCGGCMNEVGTALKVSGGTVGVWNMTTMETHAPAVSISGGKTILQGAAFHNGLSTITAGMLTMNGVLFRSPGTDVTISGGTTNLWGNIGNGGFTWNGTPASASYNIPR